MIELINWIKKLFKPEEKTNSPPKKTNMPCVLVIRVEDRLIRIQTKAIEEDGELYVGTTFKEIISATQELISKNEINRDKSLRSITDKGNRRRTKPTRRATKRRHQQ